MTCKLLCERNRDSKYKEKIKDLEVKLGEDANIRKGLDEGKVLDTTRKRLGISNLLLVILSLIVLKDRLYQHY